MQYSYQPKNFTLYIYIQITMVNITLKDLAIAFICIAIMISEVTGRTNDPVIYTQGKFKEFFYQFYSRFKKYVE